MNHGTLLAFDRVALSSTFRARPHSPGSPGFAYLAPSGDIIVDRTDHPEAPIPETWRMVARIRSDRIDDANLAAIGEALRTVALPPNLCEAKAEYQRTAGLVAFNVQGAVRRIANGAAVSTEFGDGSRFVVGRAGWHRHFGTDGKPHAERIANATKRERQQLGQWKGASGRPLSLVPMARGQGTRTRARPWPCCSARLCAWARTCSPRPWPCA